MGRYPPGSSFKVYTLAAALKANISLRSYWDWNPHDMPGRTGAQRIQNASTCGNLKAGDKTPCSLLQSTISSLNVPYYALTLSVTPTKVLEMARDMGIDYMWNDGRERLDLRGIDIKTVVPSQFDTILGIGQYPITVLDHANGMATVASAGLRAQAHFVQKVMKGDDVVYGETLPPPDQPRVLTPQQANDLTYALSQVSSAKVNIGWDTAGKTGTWEYQPTARRERARVDGRLLPEDRGRGLGRQPRRRRADPRQVEREDLRRRPAGEHLAVVHDQRDQGDERAEGEHEVQRTQLPRRHDAARRRARTQRPGEQHPTRPAPAGERAPILNRPPGAGVGGAAGDHGCRPFRGAAAVRRHRAVVVAGLAANLDVPERGG